MDNKKRKHMLGAIVLCLAVMLMAVESQPETARAAAVGYTDHEHSWKYTKWTSGSDCGGCKAKAGYTDCTTCSHTGEVSCTNSKCSSGKVTCSNCSGLGYTSTTTIISGKISVNGSLKSYGCYVTYAGCLTCGGSGQSYQYYSASSPSGEIIYTTGTRTNGSGKVNCSTCGGDGKIACSKCGGDGALSTTCTRCNGDGWNTYCS